MRDVLQSAKNCLKHAQRHVDSLDVQLGAFFDTNPFQEIKEFDPNSQTDIYKLKLRTKLPDVLSSIAFDAVGNLRAALDQAGYAVAVAVGGSGKQAYFPFGDTVDEASSRVNGASKEIPVSIFNAMIDSKPYRDGDLFLWGLNRLCNCNKHRFIVPTAIYTGGGQIKNIHFSSVNEFSFPPRWNTEAQEMILAIVPHQASFTMNMQIKTFVSFTDVEGLPVAPCLYVLENSIKSVEKVLAAIEIESKTLGL
jgi:hypothetical protein